MSTNAGTGTLTINGWAPPDKSGYLEQVSKRAPALIAPADKVLWDGLEHRPVVGYQHDWLTDDLEPLAGHPVGQGPARVGQVVDPAEVGAGLEPLVPQGADHREVLVAGREADLGGGAPTGPGRGRPDRGSIARSGARRRRFAARPGH